MKKKKILVSLLCIGAVLGVASCNTPEVTPTPETPPVTETPVTPTPTPAVVKYTVTFNSNGGSAINSVEVEENKKVTAPAAPTKEGYNFVGWFSDEALTKEWSFDTAITANTTLYAKWEAVVVEQKYNVVYDINDLGTQPAVLENVAALPAELPVLTAEGYNFLGWYTDEACTVKAVAGSAITANTVLYAKWEVVQSVETEEVTYMLKDTDFVTGKNAEDMVINNFTILANSEMRTRGKNWSGLEMHLEDGAWVSSTLDESRSFATSLKLANGGNLKITAPGNGKLSIWIQNGSSGAAMQNITFGKVDEEPETIEFVGTDGGSPVIKVTLDVEAGCEYMLGRPSGTVDLYWAELTCQVEKSDVVGFDIVSEGTVDYLVGDAYDSSKMSINAVYANGRTEVIASDDENLTIDYSKVDTSKAGVYQVSVKYKEYEAKTIDVAVYDVTELELGFNAIEKIANSSAGNGVYFNQTVQRIYLKNAEALDPSYLTVSAIAKHPVDASKSMVFVLSASEYSLSALDSSSAGKKEIAVTYGVNSQVVAKFDVWVVETAPSVVNDVVQVKVDQSYEGVVGTVVEGYNMFTSIQQALDYLQASEVASTVKKVLYICEGTYKEKLEITIPNLTIKGAGADKVLIEWDSLYGVADEGGFVHTTDSTASVSVRDGAVNCVIEGVTISNFWNSLERFDTILGESYQEHRALALLVQSDQFIMRDSSLLGYQDTVEFFLGRQLLENVYIAGTTDFIFGTNNTTYFKNCTIHSIDSHANRGNKSDGGYITAFKGSNTGESDAVKYGAIFDGCTFTADADVLADKTTAIGRTWGAYAAVMIMNSELGAHITKTENTAGNLSKNVRIVSMNGINVATSETIQFFEYNNTGEGAITESQAGVTVLTDAAEAAKYANYEIIFGKVNGKVTYMDAWDPTSTEVVVDERTYYYFDQKTNDAATSYTYDITTPSFKGSTFTLGDILISAENGNVAWNQNANALNMKANAFIKFNVKAGSEVTVNTYPKYNYFTLNGVATSNASTLTQYYAEDTEVVLMSTGDLYLYSIIINPNAEAPETAELEEIKVEGLNVNYVVGEEVSLEEVVVKALYSDSTIVALEATDYTVNVEAVNSSEAGVYEVVFTYAGKSLVVEVTYEDPNADPAITTNTVLEFKNEDTYAQVVNNKRVTMEGSFRANGSEYQIQGIIKFEVKAGTIVIVNPYNNSQYASYTIGAEGDVDLETLNAKSTFKAVKDCTVVYTGLSNNYLVSIEILCPVANETYVFGTANNMEGEYTKVVESVGNVVVSGSVRDNNDSLQLNQGSSISFVVPALSTVVLTGHSEGYGKLAASLNGVDAELVSNGSGVYTFSTKVPTTVVVNPVNVGTEEAPAYNKSYIKAITVTAPEILNENLNVSFGSNGNYKESGIDFSAIQIDDNGGNNSQIKNGSFSFAVAAGATVTINGYPGYTSYTLGDGTTTTEEITTEKYTYTATSTVLLTITPVKGNNYFYSFSIEYPAVAESFEVTFGSEGNYKESGIDFSGIQIGDNGGNNSQIKNGSFSFAVAAGATVTINGYPSYTSYKLSDGTTTTEEITDTTYVYTAESACTITITPVSGNNYFYSFSVVYE